MDESSRISSSSSGIGWNKMGDNEQARSSRVNCSSSRSNILSRSTCCSNCCCGERYGGNQVSREVGYKTILVALLMVSVVVLVVVNVVLLIVKIVVVLIVVRGF